MKKFTAIVSVVAWLGFWIFGYIALTEEALTKTQQTVSFLLAFTCLLLGLVTFFKLVRSSEESGYARKTNQLSAEERNRAHAKQAEVVAEVEGRK